MKLEIIGNALKLWLSANETSKWAKRVNATWPCSQLAGKRVFVGYDSNGLCELLINGKQKDCDSNELNAIVCDFLEERYSKEYKTLPKGGACFGHDLRTLSMTNPGKAQVIKTLLDTLALVRG